MILSRTYIQNKISKILKTQFMMSGLFNTDISTLWLVSLPMNDDIQGWIVPGGSQFFSRQVNSLKSSDAYMRQ